jgi:PAS domain S-box-containing protein
VPIDDTAVLGAAWEATSDAMALSDPDGIVLRANPAYYALYGLAPEAVIGRSFAVIFSEEARAAAEAQYRAVFAAAAVLPAYEVAVRRGDGTERVVEARHTFLEEGGRRVAMLSVVRDITERTAVEGALREGEARYRALFEAIDQGFCVIEVLLDGAGRPVDYRFVEANPAFEAMTGLWGALGRTARELVPDLEEWWFVTYGRVALTGEPARFENHAAPMGRWFDVYASRLGGDGSRRVALVFTNITERKRAEAERERLLAAERAASAAVAAERARLRELFMQAPAAICLLDGPDHVFTLANPHYLALLGREGVLGRPVHEIFPELAGQGIIELLDRVYRTGEAFVGDEVPMRLDRDGDGAPEEAYFTFVYAPFRGADGAPEGIFGLGYEVTGQVRARQAAEEAVRARDTFLSIAAHELRTPITALKGTAQLLLRRQSRGSLDADHLADALRKLDHSADRLVELTGDLLDVARIRTGQLPLDPRPIDLVALVDAAVVQARVRADDGHRLTLDAPAGVPTVVADAGRIEQVLTNLLDNALKYSPAGGAVAVAVRAEGAGAAVAVRDGGIGLPSGAAEAIFAPFGRAANAAASRLPGMGLGLFICRSIVERHGGWIAAESAGEGRGTTVTFWLPTTGPSAAARAE